MTKKKTAQEASQTPLYALTRVTASRLWERGDKIDEPLDEARREFLLDKGYASETKPVESDAAEGSEGSEGAE